MMTSAEAFIRACIQGDRAQVETALVNGTDPNVRWQSSTGLMWAAMENHSEDAFDDGFCAGRFGYDEPAAREWRRLEAEESMGANGDESGERFFSDAGCDRTVKTGWR